MKKSTPIELYQEFVEYVHSHAGSERKIANRRIFSVFLWCFIIPAAVSASLLILVKTGVLPRYLSRYMDWVILVFPILYSLYILSSEVLSEMPSVFRQGSLRNTINQAVQDTQWRVKVCEEMKLKINQDRQTWSWLVAQFRLDLETLRNRAKHLTVLAGAVFFLLMQGIDSLSERDEVRTYQSLQGWIESSSNTLAQFVGLGLFLVLFYLSGTQHYNSLRRYLACAELIVLEKTEKLN